MKREALVTITRQTGHEGAIICLSVKDSKSGNIVTEIKMNLDDFATCITGQAFAPAKYGYCPTPKDAQKFRKKRIIESRFCDKVSRDSQAEYVAKHFAENSGPPWELFSDGVGTQQPGVEHKYLVARYQ